jgi:RNA polymerase sigma-70 factor (ECF subfamily)
MKDELLIKGILKADQRCFKELVDKYQSLVLNTCNSFLHSKNDAEDITQEVFIEVYLSIHKFRGEAKLSTWLYRISVNKSLNFIRNNSKIIKNFENLFAAEQINKILDNSSLYSDIEDIQDEKIELLHKSINTLAKNQKIAFTLSKFENLSYVQISEVMNLSLASVEGLIHRAKMNVQKKILNFYKKK